MAEQAAEHIEVKKIKEIIKSVMKKQGYQYKDLANALNVSDAND